MKFSEMPYKRVDAEVFLASLRELVEAFKNAESAQEQLEIIRKKDDLCTETFTMPSLAYARYTIDTRDEFYAAEREYNNEIEPLMEEGIQEFNKVVATSKFREELEKELGKVMFLNIDLSLKGFSPEIIPLVQEENNLVAQYEKLTASAQIEFDGKICNLAQLVPYMQSTDRAVRKARARQPESSSMIIRKNWMRFLTRW